MNPDSPTIPSQTIGACIIVTSANKILLGKRKNSYKSGFYGMPGGRVEASEKIIDCAKRELLEETGIEANILEYVGAIRDRQTSFSFIHFAFLCKDFKGEPKLTEPDKCEGWEWFDSNKIPEDTLIGHKAAIDMFLSPDSPSVRDVEQA
jgi:8-oxo-dGTP diphosphatase